MKVKIVLRQGHQRYFWHGENNPAGEAKGARMRGENMGRKVQEWAVEGFGGSLRAAV